MLNTLVLHGSYARYTASPLAQKNVLVQAPAQNAFAQNAFAQNVVSDNFNGYLSKPGNPISDNFSGFLPETK
jgi:hypothetical protein